LECGREDGAFHFGVGGVDDFGAEGVWIGSLAGTRIAYRATIIDGDGISRSDIKTRRFAYRAEEIESAPRLGTDASAL